MPGAYLLALHLPQAHRTAMRDRAFELGGVPHVNAFVDRENTASARVAERCGLRRVEPSPRFYGGADRYRMTRAEWEARSGSGSG